MMANIKEYIANNGTSISYVHKSGKYDFKHCLFVFSGFPGGGDAKNYMDFANSLDNCPCDVIWVIDYFYGSPCYYLCSNNNFSIRDAILEFIELKLKELHLSFDNASITGFSKGGSAALYYGLKLPFKNIVVGVPQINIGSYVEKYWKSVAEKMMGKNYDKEKIHNLDNILKELLEITKFNKNRNIYLLTSESDIQYPTEIKPYLSVFDTLGNFFCFKTFSVFCREHSQITSHHISFLLALFNLFANNLSPQFRLKSDLDENIYNYYGKEFEENTNPTGKAFLNLTSIFFKESKLFIEGAYVLLGYEIIEYSDVKYSLILKNDNTKDIIIPLGSCHHPRITKDLFNNSHFVIYDKGKFATLGLEGIDLSNIPPNTYDLYISIKLTKSGIEKTIPLTYSKVIDIKTEDSRFSITNNSSKSSLTLTCSQHYKGNLLWKL